MLTVEQIKETVADYFKDKPVKSVYLFGSYARGEAKKGSDIDLLLDLDYEKSIGLEFARWWLVMEKKLKTKVDLVPLDKVYNKVMKNAENDKILLFQNVIGL